jgi:hypothetical protein
MKNLSVVFVQLSHEEESGGGRFLPCGAMQRIIDAVRVYPVRLKDEHEGATAML